MKCFNDYDHDHKEFYKVKPHSELKVLESDTTEGRYRVTYEVDCLSCEQVWIDYQDEAYEIIAPVGRLIHDPLQRNRAINAAYARLWLHDNRFQWAGLAAFASKQVGCGLLHATDVVMKMQAEDEAAKRLLKSTRRLDAFGLSLSYADDEALREYQLASEQNPMWTKDISPTGVSAPRQARLSGRRRGKVSTRPSRHSTSRCRKAFAMYVKGWHLVIPCYFSMSIPCICFTRSVGLKT